MSPELIPELTPSTSATPVPPTQTPPTQAPPTPVSPTLAPPIEIPRLLEKLVQASLNLHPFQALEYDPETGTLVISSENLIPERSPEILQQIVLARRADEELSIKRFPNGYKVVMARKIQL